MKALDEVLVLDLCTSFCASLGAALLGDFGARVIRVEPLHDGDREADAARREPWDWEAELAHRNKLGLAVDLDRKPGREILDGLIARADVLVTDWPAARLEAGGWHHSSLGARRPELIYGCVSAFGPEGPDADLPLIDELAAARAGLMPTRPQPGQPPVFAGDGQMYTSVMLAFGVVTALHHRAETGEGQRVDVSLLGGNMYGGSLDVQAYLAMGGERFLGPIPRLDAGNPMSGVLYAASDGRWVCLTMPDTDRWWPGFSEVVGIDADDPRFNSHEKRCEENRLEMIRVLDEIFRGQTSAHWKRELEARQLSADVIEKFDYPAADEQAYRNRYILKLDDPSLGRIRTLGFPIFMSESPARLSRRAPACGQHSAEILHDLLGYPEDRIGELETDGIIA